MNTRKLSFNEFLKIQDELNEYTVTGWKDILTPDHFKIAMLDEVAELLGSCNWAWWKKSDNYDEWNLKIECVDILHFALSSFILNGNEGENIDELYLGTNKNEPKLIVYEDSGKLSYSVCLKHVSELINSGNYESMDAFISSVGLDVEEVSAIYVAKATLNKIRQNMGYQNGNYVKNRDGIEDNNRLQVVIEIFMNDINMTLDNVVSMTYNTFVV